MSREEVHKLLGGYATGTLTAEEQQALFEAALEDQELFDTLAREQGLRDLLRDPSAKAELLAALDEPAPRGILAWLRRPMVAGLAMAGVAALAVVVWQGSRKPAPVLIAEVKQMEAPQAAAPVVPAPPTAPAAPAATASPSSTRETGQSRPVRQRNEKDRREFRAPVEALRDKEMKRVDVAAEAPVLAQSKSAEVNIGQQAQLNQVQIAPAPVNSAMQNQTNSAQVNSANALDQRQQNARALFYGPQSPINARTGFTDSLAEDSKDSALKAEKKAGQRAAGLTKGALGGAAVPAVLGGAAGAAHLGVRCSIVREGNREVDLSTPLYAGESVKLRLTPNADGILTVSEGEGATARVVATAPVRQYVAFETSALKSDAPGQRQFHVTLTRGAMEKLANSGFAFSRANLVETTSDKDHATYVVLGDGIPGSQQVMVPITLTWR
jgi:hypothetical protein